MSTAFSGGAEFRWALATDPDGTPFIAYPEKESADSDRVVVRAFRDGAWQTLETPLFGGVTANLRLPPSLAVDTGGRPLIALLRVSAFPGSILEVFRFDDDGKWRSLGQPGTQFDSAFRLAVLDDDSPVVVWLENVGPTLLLVARHDGQQWVRMGRELDATPNATLVFDDRIDIAGGPDGPWVTYAIKSQDGRETVALNLMRFNGRDWEAQPIPAKGANQMAMTLMGGVPLIAVNHETDRVRLSTMRFIGGRFVDLFDATPPSTRNFRPWLAAGGGRAYVSSVAFDIAELQQLLFPSLAEGAPWIRRGSRGRIKSRSCPKAGREPPAGSGCGLGLIPAARPDRSGDHRRRRIAKSNVDEDARRSPAVIARAFA